MLDFISQNDLIAVFIRGRSQHVWQSLLNRERERGTHGRDVRR